MKRPRTVGPLTFHADKAGEDFAGYVHIRNRGVLQFGGSTELRSGDIRWAWRPVRETREHRGSLYVSDILSAPLEAEDA